MTPNAPAIRFTYQAAGRDGRIERGSLAATTRAQAIGELSARGLMMVRLVEERSHAQSRSPISASELAIGLHVMSDLLDSGLALARALSALELIVSPRWRAALPEMRESIREGKSLAQALEDVPLSIPRVVTGIIRAGERGSGLAAALRAAAELSRERAETQSAVRNALAYPIMLACAGTASVGLLVAVVLPRFARILGDMGQELPMSTRLVLTGATYARMMALPAFAAAIATFLVWRGWTSSVEGRRTWDGWLLAVPGVGGLRMGAASARSSAALSALLESGVPLVSALQHAAAASGDAAVEARLLAARAAIVQGERPSRAFERHAALTDVTLRLIHAGEESGRLASMLAHAARLEREHMTQRLRTAVRLIEPIMIVAFGGLVALVAASLLQALYSVRPGA